MRKIINFEMRNTLTLILFALTFILKIASSAPEAALVETIPGFHGTFPSKHYSGYVTIDETYGKKLYYYFVESEKNPSTDPVVLWLNGGPGCSSFDGFVYEHGPFNFEAGNPSGSLPNLHLNPYSWSKVSSVIYLDSPAGVGFSYSGNETDYTTGDLKTASDSHIFLLKWFELYPEFLSNSFYISGQSYAGIYVPTLSYEVVQGIDAGLMPIINLKGYMVGNGVTDVKFDGNSFVPFAHGMGLISDELFEAVKGECYGEYYNIESENCKNKLAEVHKELDGLNRYNILEPCYHASEIKNRLENMKLPLRLRRLGEMGRPLHVRERMLDNAWSVKTGGLPCIDDEVATAWLSNEAVAKAIHAESENVLGKYELCTDRITFYHDAGSMIKYHKYLTSRGYRALIYSGDHDMCVPFKGTEAWTRSIGYEIIDKRRPWIVQDQVAGYIQVYDYNLTFLTIKGAGHAVPEYKPREALEFYSRWLAGLKI